MPGLIWTLTLTETFHQILVLVRSTTHSNGMR